MNVGCISLRALSIGGDSATSKFLRLPCVSKILRWRHSQKTCDAHQHPKTVVEFFPSSKRMSCRTNLQRPYIRPVTIRTFRKRLFVDDYRLIGNQTRLRMTFVALHICVAALQREVCPCVVVEGRRNPAPRIVTIRASRLPRFHKLACMRIFVTILANLRRALKLYLLLSHRHFMTVATLDRTVRA